MSLAIGGCDGRRRRAVLGWIGCSASVLVGITLIVAAVGKIRRPDVFLDVVYSYGLLSAALADVVAGVLPWVELALGLALVVGLARRASSAMAVALLLTFIGAQMFVLMTDGEVACGCFGFNPEEEPISSLTLLRTGGLAVLAGVAAVVPAGRGSRLYTGV